MQVQLVSPERILYTGEATMVLARTLGGGDIAFLPGHAPFIGALAVHPVVIRSADGSEVRVASHGGFVEVSGDTVTILSDIAELAEDIDVGRAQAAKAAAESALAANDDDTEARAALARATARLETAGATVAAH